MMVLENKLPAFEQLIFDVYTIYHTKKSYRTSSKLCEQIEKKYHYKSDDFNYIAYYDLGNQDDKLYESALYHCVSQIIREVLGKTQILGLAYNKNYKSNTFTLNFFRKNNNYIVFLVSYLEYYISNDIKKVIDFGLPQVILNIESEFKNLNKSLYGNKQDKFLNGLKDDLINLMKSRLDKLNYDENEKNLDKSIDVNLDLSSKDIKSQLLSQLKSLNPTQFEHFALFLIASITKEKDDNISDLITHNGQVGDGGIDGIVNIKTPLNTYDKYFIQCKRYDKTTIGRPELQAFVGSMVGHNANKGIFITTSNFTSQALEYVNNLHNYSITTMNGSDLAKYMLEHKIGVVEESHLSLDKNLFDNFKK